ncbi:molybdenum cofactor sulfurase-like [Dreissena polymorpha]|uniref:molybdenum cofactor sulfurase-like n=1 Tax=Dreissena polymorpha TaxID=45954 RepID=UPI0022648386|nr:molybdenum cofactor sulfurase-like [Dreissena polymorpha]
MPLDEVYLDHAGATLTSRSQLDAVHHDLSTHLYGNPHSRGHPSQLTSDTVDQIRCRVLQHFSASSTEYSLIFTSGCTGALKLLAEAFDYQGRAGGYGNKDVGKGHDSDNKGDNSSTLSKNPSTINDSVNEFQSCRKGSFTYLLDNHTSAQGMREYAFQKAGKVQCIDLDIHGNTISHSVLSANDSDLSGNHLFVYPAQSNFSGKKYPVDWIHQVKRGQMPWQQDALKDVNGSKRCENCWFTALDAASLVSTSPLDLGSIKPDFVIISFYKMFGFPTGLGALIVHNKAAHVLKKTYFGGGTVAVSLAKQRFHVSRSSLSQRFEDGTIPFLDIISLRHGFDALNRFYPGGMLDISQMTFTLAQFFHHQLTSCHHGNGSCLAEVYCEDNFQNIETQGAIVTFNLLRANGNYIGFSEVEKLGQLYNIHFRTGCFCNIGACQKYLKMSDEQIQGNFSAGHVCGDDLDLIDGRPTGAVRVSFGYMSTMLDAKKCLQFIVDCFLERCDKQVFCSKNIWQPVGKTVAASDSSKVSEKNNVNTQLLNDITVNASDTQYDNTIVNEEKSSLAQSSNIENTKVSQQLSGKVNKMMVCVEMNFETPSEIRKVNTKLEQLIQNKEHSYGDLNPDIVTMVTEETEEFEACEGRVLADIFLYPVKSCAAFRVPRWPLCSRGLLYDREWMIVMETGIALTQKREYRLCLLRPSIDLLSGQLILAFPGMNVLRLSLTDMVGDQNEASLCNGKVCGDRVSSVDCGVVVADWLSEALCRPGCRLIRQAADDTRASKLKSSTYDSTSSDMRLSLSNESQYLMITQDSTAALHQKILERYQEGDADACFDVNNLVDRFRANLVVRGCSPFEEDTWSSVQIGKLHFQSQGQCSRCQMVCMDQSSGERSGEPLKTLAVWRGKKIPFGIHLGHAWKVERDFTEIQVGDPVFVTI